MIAHAHANKANALILFRHMLHKSHRRALDPWNPVQVLVIWRQRRNGPQIRSLITRMIMSKLCEY